jgi:hypothetical protein
MGLFWVWFLCDCTFHMQMKPSLTLSEGCSLIDGRNPSDHLANYPLILRLSTGLFLLQKDLVPLPKVRFTLWQVLWSQLPCYSLGFAQVYTSLSCGFFLFLFSFLLFQVYPEQVNQFWFSFWRTQPKIAFVIQI